ncbi:cytochrome P450 [Sorangium cellulosum]|uniref:Cytochrome n=1 Tax=Sorangium cellulosum TaxID=56 RepID=A0A150QNA5_SORCE|nr:cytochrome P450 [Sorangium cellulosum]KYF69461.1 cytochrome [Sorangium cellulosum]
MNRPIDVLAPEFRANPYPVYAEMRRASPVCQVEPGGMWLATRYDDVLFILKTPGVFSSEGFKATLEPPWVGYNPLGNSMIALDPPSHTRLRALIHRAFGAATVARMAPRLHAVAAELADGLAGEVDFVEALANPLPAFAIGEILGFDHALRADFRRWSDDIATIMPEPLDPEQARRVRTTIADLTRYMMAVIEQRRRAPTDDPVSDLVRAEVDGQRLTDAEIVEFLFLLLIAGLETTTHLLGNSLLFLADHPDMMERLRADPALIPLFVEEMLRFDGPIHMVPRITTTEVAISGVTVPRGALLLPVLASANRDEKRFKDPDRFDLHRGAQGALPFGHGIHFCIGAALARLEARATVEAVIARYQRIERVPGEIRYNHVFTIRGPVALPLRFIPAGSAPGA